MCSSTARNFRDFRDFYFLKKQQQNKTPTKNTKHTKQKNPKKLRNPAHFTFFDQDKKQEEGERKPKTSRKRRKRSRRLFPTSTRPLTKHSETGGKGQKEPNTTGSLIFFFVVSGFLFFFPFLFLFGEIFKTKPNPFIFSIPLFLNFFCKKFSTFLFLNRRKKCVPQRWEISRFLNKKD